jgi:hypothetical protein
MLEAELTTELGYKPFKFPPFSAIKPSGRLRQVTFNQT